MIEALAILDSTPVLTEADPYLDHAIHYLTDAITNVKASVDVFTASNAMIR